MAELSAAETIHSRHRPNNRLVAQIPRMIIFLRRALLTLFAAVSWPKGRNDVKLVRFRLRIASISSGARESNYKNNPCTIFLLRAETTDAVSKQASLV